MSKFLPNSASCNSVSSDVLLPKICLVFRLTTELNEHQKLSKYIVGTKICLLSFKRKMSQVEVQIVKSFSSGLLRHKQRLPSYLKLVLLATRNSWDFDVRNIPVVLLHKLTITGTLITVSHPFLFGNSSHECSALIESSIFRRESLFCQLMPSTNFIDASLWNVNSHTTSHRLTHIHNPCHSLESWRVL